MPLPDIQLDDRTFEDLVAEAIRRIPSYTPEWTDFNQSDPGIALVQLLAWLEEIILYRLNQVPDKNYIKFLEMVGVSLNLPAPAQAELTFTLTSKTLPNAILVPQGTQVSLAGAVNGQPVIFETTQNLYAVGGSIQAVMSFDGAQYQLQTQSNNTPGQVFYAFSNKPQAGAALYIGFDQPFPTGTFVLTIHATADPAFPIAQGDVASTPGVVTTTPPVMSYWEYWNGAWTSLPVSRDTTQYLTTNGTVTFTAPSDMVATQYGILQKPSDPQLYWFRYRIAQILGPGYESPPVLEDVLINTVPAQNVVTEQLELLGASNGLPNQTFTLAHNPVLPMPAGVTGIVEVNEGSGYALWTEVDDFNGSSRTDTVYTIDLSTGTIAFGDGTHGKIPRWLSGDSSNSTQSDLPNIRVTQYQWGGGSAGNGGANTVTTLETAIPFVASVTNLRPAAGGSDEETVDDAEDRAPQAIRTQSRAVTGDDFAFLATGTPGAQIARATALPLYNPSLDISAGVPGQASAEASLPGVVTVIVVPQSPDPAPAPSAATLQLVANWLDQHRLITTELYVIGPTYRQVEIVGNVIAQPTSNAGQVAQQLQASLLAYFNPLTGGVEGQGWDFGGTIYFSEVYRQILIAPGVLRIAANAITIVVDGKPQPAGQDIALNPNELVYSTNHAITVTYS
jgi:predicted phage baseplate assembly protein